MENQVVVIIDFGGQYKELIARRVRECGVYSLIKHYTTPVEEIRAMRPVGIIFTGGPNSVYEENAPVCSEEIFTLGVPVLGICYGMQLMCHMLGGEVSSAETSEYGRTQITLESSCALFQGIPAQEKVLMSHTDRVSVLPEGFRSAACTEACPVAAMEDKERRFYGVQFHPEVETSDHGTDVIRNFLFEVCHASGDYSMRDYLNRQIEAVRRQVGKDKVILGLSGGVDSSVCAALLSKAIPHQVICIFVDHGLMRWNEANEIDAIFSHRDVNFVRVDAQDRFISRLAGITEPEMKRKIIGEEFVRVFEEQAARFTDAKYLAQGTIYPDIVESGTSNSATIKSHHNVGGLPEKMGFKGIVEPLRGLFKDEVRKIGAMLKLPQYLIERQPFPGPGLAIRILGDITYPKLEILRKADWILRQEIDQKRSHRPDQYFAVLTNIRSVGVMGDFRTYDYTIALRAVKTNDFMTCEFARIDYELLARISARITGEVKGVNRVVYDITSKPPATIEYE